MFKALGMVCLSCGGSASPPPELQLYLCQLRSAVAMEDGDIGVAAVHALGDCVCLWRALVSQVLVYCCSLSPCQMLACCTSDTSLLCVITMPRACICCQLCDEPELCSRGPRQVDGLLAGLLEAEDSQHALDINKPVLNLLQDHVARCGMLLACRQ